MRWIILITWLAYLLLALGAVISIGADNVPADKAVPALLILAWIAIFGAYGSAMGFKAARLTRQLRNMQKAARTF